MKYFFFVLAVVSIFPTAPPLIAQRDLQLRYASMITKSDLLENLSIIASDALEGRQTGTRGQKMAAAFISSHFQDLGLTAPVGGSYYQPFTLYEVRQGNTFVKVGENTFNNFAEVVSFEPMNSNGPVQQEAVFVGGGSEEEMKQVNVKGKAAVLWIKGGSFVGTKQPVEKLREAGASIVLVYSGTTVDQFKSFATQMKNYIEATGMSMERPAVEQSPRFFVNRKVMESLFGDINSLGKLMDSKKPALKKVTPVAFTYQVDTKIEPVSTSNVLGYLEGTDKKDELIVITAHYDHVGKNEKLTGDQINNGADDDGSGTVAVLQMAKVFAQAKKDGHGPRRSMLFMTVTAEELGLFGSEYYTDNPVFPLQSTVVDLNIDMIGRWDAEHKGQPDYVYVIGSDKLSSELHEINERNNSTFTKLAFDYTYNDENHPTNLYKRSDHWNFAKHGIPIIFYFDGIHEDYHKPSDEVSKIDFDILVKRTQCVFYTAWEVANRDERLKVDK